MLQNSHIVKYNGELPITKYNSTNMLTFLLLLSDLQQSELPSTLLDGKLMVVLSLCDVMNKISTYFHIYIAAPKKAIFTWKHVWVYIFEVVHSAKFELKILWLQSRGYRNIRIIVFLSMTESPFPEMLIIEEIT